ncbi:GNAT family N-acetyltransferase [Gloeocapsa sp. BRSZ]
MLEQTYLKVPFVWEPKPLTTSHRLTFAPVSTMHNDVLFSVVARVMSSSIDASDRAKVSIYSAYAAAEIFLNSARDGFSYQNEWWQFGMNENQDIVGFVLPVVFTGCAKDGLEEGSIYYMGILPEYQGLGFASDFLSKGTRILQETGVWRVFCDTAVNNVRMISTFKRVGYQQYSEPWERPI